MKILSSALSPLDHPIVANMEANLLVDKFVMFSPPVVPVMPIPEPLPPSLPQNRSLIIVERLVFAVDKRSREVSAPYYFFSVLNICSVQ